MDANAERMGMATGGYIYGFLDYDYCCEGNWRLMSLWGLRRGVRDWLLCKMGRRRGSRWKEASCTVERMTGILLCGLVF